MRALPLLLFLCSCSTQIPQGIELDCYTETDPCPALEEVQRVMDLFGEAVPAFNPDEALTISWWDRDHDFWIEHRPDGTVWRARGFTPDGFHISTTGMRIFIHELRHADYFRTTGDGDQNHEAPPGPWTEADNELIREVELGAGY